MTRHRARTGSWIAAGLICGILGGAGLPAAQAAERPLPCYWPAAESVDYCGWVPTSTVRCSDWSVKRIGTPAERARIVVSAACKVRPAERLALRRVEPQGINPTNLLLELVVSRIPFPDVWIPADRVDHIELDYGYRSVTILPDGPTLPVGLLG